MRICLIGCGGHAQSYYADSLKRYKQENPGTILAACCDVDISKAAVFGEKAGIERTYDDYMLMIEREKPDAVFIVTGFIHTPEVAVKIAGYGGAIMLEKPLGAGLDDCMAIAEAFDKYNVANQAAFNRRHMPLIRALASELGAEDGPGFDHIDFKMYRVNRRETYFETTAIHGIDLIGFLAGSDYSRVQFMYQESVGKNGRAINTHMQAVFKSGSTAQLSFCPSTGVVVERLTVIKESQTYFVNLPIWHCPDTPGNISKYESGRLVYDKSGLEISDGERVFEDNGFYAEIKDFLDCVKEGRSPRHSVKTAIDSMRIMDCMKLKKTEYMA